MIFYVMQVHARAPTQPTLAGLPRALEDADVEDVPLETFISAKHTHTTQFNKSASLLLLRKSLYFRFALVCVRTDLRSQS